MINLINKKALIINAVNVKHKYQKIILNKLCNASI